MTLALELGSVHDPAIRRQLEIISQQFPVTAAGGGGGAPSGPAGGVLGGTYPNPGFAADMATQAELDAHTGLTTTAHGGIVASSDARLTDARTPTAHHTTHEPGGTDAMAVDASAATGSLRTIGTGALQATAGNDSRLTNARTPTAHATTHQPGGSDAMAVDAAAATGSLRTLGTTATSAAAGNRGLPVGGTTGQVLSKNTATDYDAGWTTPAGGGSIFYDGLQAGVVATGDCALTVNTTAQVTIAAGTVYHTVSGVLTRLTPGSTVLGSIPAASASNFRLDQVVMDTAGVVSRLAGTQSTTVTLANRTGAAALGTNKLLYDILVTATGVTAANCRDRRTWARGAFWFYERTAGDYTPVAATIIDATNMAPRIECSGAPLRIVLAPGGYAIAAATIDLEIRFDAVATTPAMRKAIQASAGDNPADPLEFVITPTAGSKVIAPYCITNAGGGTVKASATYPLRYWIEEIVRQNSSNGT